MRRMRFEEILLALISRRAQSGYELKRWLDVEGVFLRANADQAQIYRTLKRLETAEFITHDVQRRNGPDAKIFHLTELGARQLRSLAEAPYVPPARWQEADFTARIALLAPIHPPGMRAMIDTEIAFREAQIEEFRGRDQAYGAASGLIPYDSAMLDSIGHDLDEFGRASTDAWLEWLRGLREKWTAALANGLRSPE